MKFQFLSMICVLCLACLACNSAPEPAPAPIPQIVVVQKTAPPDPAEKEVVLIPEPKPLLELLEDEPLAEGSVGVIGGKTAPQSMFPAVGRIDAVGMSTGTLISERIVVTAAHCVYGRAQNGVKFTLNGKSYQSTAVRIHPDYNPKAFSLGNDIALVQLATEVPNAQPATLDYTPPFVGQDVTLAGYGLTGSGSTGETGGAGTLRYGDQRWDYILPPYSLWMYTAPEVVSIGRGDSGGPIFAKGTFGIVGIASGASVGSGGKVGVWGTYAYGTRIDIHRDWLVDTMATLK